MVQKSYLAPFETIAFEKKTIEKNVSKKLFSKNVNSKKGVRNILFKKKNWFQKKGEYPDI